MLCTAALSPLPCVHGAGHAQRGCGCQRYPQPGGEGIRRFRGGGTGRRCGVGAGARRRRRAVRLEHRRQRPVARQRKGVGGGGAHLLAVLLPRLEVIAVCRAGRHRHVGILRKGAAAGRYAAGCGNAEKTAKPS